MHFHSFFTHCRYYTAAASTWQEGKHQHAVPPDRASWPCEAMSGASASRWWARAQGCTMPASCLHHACNNMHAVKASALSMVRTCQHAAACQLVPAVLVQQAGQHQHPSSLLNIAMAPLPARSCSSVCVYLAAAVCFLGAEQQIFYYYKRAAGQQKHCVHRHSITH